MEGLVWCVFYLILTLNYLFWPETDQTYLFFAAARNETNISPPVFPMMAIREYLQPNVFSNSLETKLCSIVFPLAPG